MIRKAHVLAVGLILAGVGFYLFPFGMDIFIYLAIQAMGGSYWGGIFLTYVITSSMILIGLILIARPHWFYKPSVLIGVLAFIALIVFVTIRFAAGRF